MKKSSKSGRAVGYPRAGFEEAKGIAVRGEKGRTEAASGFRVLATH